MHTDPSLAAHAALTTNSHRIGDAHGLPGLGSASMPHLLFDTTERGRLTMKRNMSGTDRVIRVLLAGGLTGLAFVFPGPWMIVLLILAVIMLVTGATGVCPLYDRLHIKTLKTYREEHGS